MGLIRDAVYGAGALLASPFLVWRLATTGKWRTDWPGRLGRTPPISVDSRPTVLIHGVSVGEVNATRTLVDELLEPGDVRVVVSATTDTGFARARALYEGRLQVVRFPLDLSGAMNRFLDAVRPDAVVLMELELWPNFFEAARKRGIPVGVVNGRLSESSYRNYRRVRPLVKGMFGSLAFAAVQNPEYAERFLAMGVDPQRLFVTDSMKWDTALVADHVEGQEALARAFGIEPHRPLVVAGSTGPGEEEILLEGCPPDAQLLIAPRAPERFDGVAGLDSTFVRRSEHPDSVSGEGPAREEPTGEGGRGSSRFLLDTLGELRKAYALADVVIVGRSFKATGGSDPIEAVGLGRPTVIGPHFEHFASVVESLLEGGGIRVSEDPMAEALRLLDEPGERERLGEGGREVIRAHRGASRKNAGLIRDALRGAGRLP